MTRSRPTSRRAFRLGKRRRLGLAAVVAGVAACGMVAAMAGPSAAAQPPRAASIRLTGAYRLTAASRLSAASRLTGASRLSAASRLDSAGGGVGGVGGVGVSTIGLGGWQVQTTTATTSWTNGQGATQDGNEISEPGFGAAGWLPVAPDDAGAVGTEVEALLQNGVCPDDQALQPVNQSVDSPQSVFYSNNMQLCFGAPMTSPGADTDPLFDVPWWFRTTFSPGLAPGQDATLVINGVMGQADVWVNGTEVATEATVEGDYTSYSFDVTNLIRPGPNALALELYPNDPNTMFTLDDVDWNQIPPDNNTGVQFPVQLHVSDALAISNTYVTQDDAPDMSSAALTVHADVTNTTDVPQAGTIVATITPPPGGGPIEVAQPVTLPARAAQTVTFTPGSFGQLVIANPQLWWPYQMGGQPLYTLRAAVTAGGGISDAAPPVDFGIRSVTTYLTPPSTMAPEGVRVFKINGVPFDFRAGGWSENLFLHYSASDLANQITLMKSMGINGIRTEGKEMPQNFYDQMDRAGILIDAGFQCCDKWAPPFSGRGVTAQDYHVMYLSSLTIGEQLRDHPSVLNFSWSDNNPINEQETASLAGFSQSGFQDPIISSAEYNPAGILGPSGEKEGPYDWVPPSYWYDTTHSSNNAVDDDSTLTNVGGSWGFDSEQSAGATVPTMDSIQRFLSPSDQAALWQQPDAHQYHLNYESTDGSHSGYSFGTLDNLDTAIKARYGSWDSLAQYVEEAQVQNYEDTRAQFEAFIDHWDNYPTPSTGTDYWQLNKGWPTMLWDLYNYDYDEAGSYFGAQEANQDLHVLYAYDTGQVTVDNLTGVSQPGLSVQARVYGLDGQVLDDQTTSRQLTLAPQQVVNGVLTPKVPATTTPPTAAQTYFVELILRQHGAVVDRNVYWLSTQQDVIDWDTGNPNDITEGNPQANNGAPLSQYADMTALQTLPSEPVAVAAATRPQRGPDGDDVVTSVTITNPASNPAVAFFLRADVRRGNAGGAAQPGDNEVLPITWSDNDITLWPGESQTLTAAYRSSLLDGAVPVVSVYGWNVPDATFAAPQTSAAAAAEAVAAAAGHVQHFGAADGTPLALGGARPGSGQPATLDRTAAGTATGTATGTAGPAWTITSVANSPDTTPSTSFTQGDNADTYMLTVTNSGRGPTDGTTPVTLTDIVDPNLNFVSAAGTGWTCDSSNNPTITCAETGGPGGAPAVLAPGQSYPPVTVTVQVPLGTGFGNQDSNDGLHVTNAALVTGGGPAGPSASLASPTPIVGVPELTADNAVDGAFRQGDAGDRYEITVMNVGGAPTNGSPASPMTATVTVSAGQTIGALYGSGWTCNLGAITSPQAEPADTCYRGDVLPGENGEDPPITVVVGVADNAPATGTETVKVNGGGSVGGAASVTATTAIAPAPPPPSTGPVSATPPELTVTSSHTGSFAQGDASDAYTLEVSDAAGAGPTSGPVTVADTLPPGITPVEMTGDGWTCSLAPPTLPPTSSSRRNPVTNTYEPQPVCSRSDVLAPGTSYPPITLDVAVADNAQPSVTNTAEAYGGGSGVVAAGTDPTTVRQLPALAVFSYPSAGGVPYAPFTRGGAGDVYHVIVANDGYAPTSGPVSFVADLPPGLTAVSVSAPPGWSCTLATASCVTRGGVSLAAGEEDAIAIGVAVSADAPVSAQAFFQASRGGEIPPAGLDTNNDYSTVSNGGEFTDPTYIAPYGM
jgi:exo-1,4-beta-D-glucosaminidase